MSTETLLPSTVNLNQLAALLGVNATSIGSAVRKGHVIKTGRNAYDLAASVKGYCEALRERPNKGETTDAKERLTAAQADLAELKLAEARKELLPADAVEARWASILQQVKSQMLGVPAKIQSDLPHLTPFDSTTVAKHIRAALADLGGDHA